MCGKVRQALPWFLPEVALFCPPGASTGPCSQGSNQEGTTGELFPATGVSSYRLWHLYNTGCLEHLPLTHSKPGKGAEGVWGFSSFHFTFKMRALIAILTFCLPLELWNSALSPLVSGSLNIYILSSCLPMSCEDHYVGGASL